MSDASDPKQKGNDQEPLIDGQTAAEKEQQVP